MIEKLPGQWRLPAYLAALGVGLVHTHNLISALFLFAVPNYYHRAEANTVAVICRGSCHHHRSEDLAQVANAHLEFVAICLQSDRGISLALRQLLFSRGEPSQFLTKLIHSGGGNVIGNARWKLRSERRW